ncbi:MAG: nucleotidyl transferase AbiEii/AbiGii toxin family protein [Elusimicrobia bacterium]|nr:nucleotidyl transferase AbiEii/AbiGii toxin family protein [Elusimicrobiota bacterium]
MITVETIQKLATQHQTTAINIAREYCQHLFLSAFYQRHAADRVLFKGGTALRIIYGSPRFSEDLDFSGFGIRKPAIEELITDTLSIVERVGVSIDIEEAKAISGGYLGIIHNRFGDYRVEIRLEISLRDRSAVKPETALIAGDFLPAYTLLHLPQELLVEEKLKALLDRAKPRDFYDLYFILRKGLLPQRDRRILKEVLIRLKAMKSEPLQELKLFLPRDQQGIAKDFRVTLERELRRYLGK